MHLAGQALRARLRSEHRLPHHRRRNSSFLISRRRLNHCDIGFPTDHAMLVATCEVDRRIHVRTRMRKPIGRNPTSFEGYNEETFNFFHERGTMTISEIFKELGRIASRSGAPQRKMPRLASASSRRGSAPSSEVRSARRCSDAQRSWCRRQIESEKKPPWSAHAMSHPRGESWGAHLKPRLACVLSESGENTRDSGSIQAGAHKYYSTLFERVKPEHLHRDALVTEALREHRSANTTSESSVNTELLRRANLPLKPRETWGADSVVAEMLSDCDRADWQWAVAFNLCVMNAPELDSRGVVADAPWGRFDISLLPNANAPVALNMLRPIAILLASAKLWSRCSFTILGDYDVQCSAPYLGFRRGHMRSVSCHSPFFAGKTRRMEVASPPCAHRLRALTTVCCMQLPWTPWVGGPSQDL